MDNRSIILQMKEVDHQIFKVVCAKYKAQLLDITPIQGRIIMFIYQSVYEVCQKDVENHVAYNKSTISSILDNMEKNSLIERKCINGDLRKKMITLTPKAVEIVEILKKHGEYLDEKLITGITAEETKIFCNVLNKIKNNIGRIENEKNI